MDAKQKDAHSASEHFASSHDEKGETFIPEESHENEHAKEGESAEHAAVSSFTDELSASIKMIAQYVKQQTDDIKKKSLSREYLNEQLSEMRKEIIPMIDKVETKINELKNQPTEELERKIERLEMRLSDVNHMKSKHGELEKKVTELHGTIGTKALSGAVESRELVEAHIRRINDLEKKVDDMGKVMARGGQGIVLSKLREEMRNELEETRREMGARMKMHGEQSSGIIDDTSLKNVRRELLTEVNNLRAEMEDTRNSMNKMVMHAPVLEGKGKVQIEGRDYKDLHAELRDIRKTMDEESTTRIALDKKITDLNMDVKNIYASMSKFKDLEKLDYDKILAAYEKEKNIDEEVNKKLRTEIMKIVGQQLADFSKVMDKKIPNLVTKDDLAKMEAYVRQKKTVVSTGLPIDRRIDTLEKRMDELVETLKSFRSPFVLE